MSNIHIMDEEQLVVEVKIKKRGRKKKVEEGTLEADLNPVTSEDLKIKVPKKKKERVAKDLRTVFKKHLEELKIETLHKPWMDKVNLLLLDTEEALAAWIDKVITTAVRNESNYIPLAADCETISLDTRIFYYKDKSKIKNEIAGICLCASKDEAVYISIHHENCKNIPLDKVRSLLQPLFDIAHLIFYNGKFDREILRLCCGLRLPLYPHFEDVQVINYINDPKADLGDKGKKYTGSSGGLKALSKNILKMEQIELDTLTKVKADYFDISKDKITQRLQHVPFTWIPTNIAVLYAAPDALCTYLLWLELFQEARSRPLVHRIDHEATDTLTWIERQRFNTNVERHKRTVIWHKNKLAELRADLRNLALAQGYVEKADEDGKVLEEDKFNPDSNPQLTKFLFQVRNFPVKIRSAKTGSPSANAEVISGLVEDFPQDEFLKKFSYYKSYVALHPESLTYDPEDNSSRIFLRHTTVAGGRLSGNGGEDFYVDGGFGLNPQGIKRVEGNWWVRGNVLVPDTVDPTEVVSFEEKDLHPSCFNKKTHQKATGIINNHIGQYLGYSICLVPKCTSCEDKYGVLIRNDRLDANEVINLRVLFSAYAGWTFFTTDYSNIEMRAAANLSGEPLFIKEFLEGEGDFHSLTASQLFPEFNDPNITKEKHKELRSLAKIINFALLYGGTEHTIYNNLKKVQPDITYERASELVKAYWASVPIFKAFCQNKQDIAKEDLTCTTATGRVVKFASAMEALGISKPTKKEAENYWNHRKLLKKARELNEASNEEGLSAEAKNEKLTAAYKLNEKANLMYLDKDLGIRNYKEYLSFMNKVQRVAVNIPIQGIAGDFMRIALNRIRIWATQEDPLVQSVMRIHGTVHDEIDYTVKDAYIPFVVPRITRFMKLRKYHIKCNWPVPIECDTEYGTSWDIEHHLTGNENDGVPPLGWWGIEALRSYIPPEFNNETFEALLNALSSNEPKRVGKALAWLRNNLNTKTSFAIDQVEKAKELEEIRKALLISLQLHEFFNYDEVPDSEKMENLETYEKARNLGPADRGFMPPTGFLGEAVGEIVRPELKKLWEETTLPTVEKDQTPPVDEAPAVVKEETIPILRSLSVEEAKCLREKLRIGRNTIKVCYEGEIVTLTNVGITHIPEEFLYAN